MVGTPVVEMHVEAETDECICTRLNRCGGIVFIDINCPEHSGPKAVSVPFHTHPKQARRAKNSGRHYW